MRWALADSAIGREGSARTTDAGNLGRRGPRVNRRLGGAQNGFTITMMTMTIISSVGTSFM